jgi:hypothetical protein
MVFTSRARARVNDRHHGLAIFFAAVYDRQHFLSY